MARRGCVCGFCENVNQPSVCTSCINQRLMEKYKLLKHLAHDRDLLRRRLDEELIAKREAELQGHWRVDHLELRNDLRERLRLCKEELVEGKTKFEQQQRDLDVKISLLSEASANVATKRMEKLTHYYPDFIRAQSLVHMAVASELFQKRRIVMRQLCKILPLRRTSGQGERREKWAGTSSIQSPVQICGARLPVGDDPLSTPALELAASLGYMVQLVNLAARYLSAPLLHNAGFAASSSRVWQRANYTDSRPASRSEEYPLFLPRQGGRGGSSVDDNIELSRSAGSNLWFSSMESPRSDPLGSMGTLVNYGGASSSTRDIHPEVQRGIQILQRSVGCICTYGFGILSLPVPSDLSTFDAFSELLSSLSSKAAQTRSSRRNQQANSRFAISEGPLAYMGSSLPNPLDTSHSYLEALGHKALLKGRVTNFNNLSESGTNSELMAGTIANLADSTVDGWDIVEHPRLPPPSRSEDVEHWTRAMFIDATK
ncbi:unnamed protein product [Sphagnum jensenii]|uniref:Uncharacterized protein n=1 Tax=Sphagnum jensenii TaxID=128206 RepID=A0ABP1AM70_9BRYO